MLTVDGFNQWWRPARRTDAFLIEPHLSKADQLELKAGGLAFQDAVAAAFSMDGLTFTMIDHASKDEPVGMFGLVAHPADPMIGLVWALTTPRIRTQRRVFLNVSRQWVEWCHSLRPILTNFVWTGNLQHILWLRSLGFSLIAEHEVNGAPYYEFVKVPSHV